MRRITQGGACKLYYRSVSSGLDGLLAELSSVNTSSKAEPARKDRSPKLKKVVRVLKNEDAVQESGGEAMLASSLRELKGLEEKLINVERQQSSLIGKVATESQVEKETIAFPSAQMPLSSQETRLSGGEQEFTQTVGELPSQSPSSGSVAFATIIAKIASPIGVYEDTNGQFIEFSATYTIPFEIALETSVSVRCYGSVFIEYCQENVKVGNTIHAAGWLLPSPEGKATIVCLPKGGNLTVVKY